MPSFQYTVAMSRPETHLFEVTLEVRGLNHEFADLVMPVWTPGSYKVRDYARNVQDFEAPGRRWMKTAKHRWRVFLGGSSGFTARYRVYAFELNVRGLHLDTEHGYFNGAAVFMYVDGFKQLPVTLHVRPARGWKIATGLARLAGNRFRARDYDILVDSPVECGRFELRTWRQQGLDHRLAIHGRVNMDRSALVQDIRKIVDAESRIFGGLPYRDYTFILHALSGDGGLEHLNSTSLQVPPDTFRPRAKYERFLRLVAHEFFHLWNVKRIHPAALGPFDYERENHTGLLWVMEGFTSYYEVLALRRARLVDVPRTLKVFAERIQQYQEKPGRRHQSLSESSFDAWIKFYNPSEHTPNSQVSYYEKGALVAMLLDLEIRHRTRNRRSLDSVMRTLWDEFGRVGQGFAEPEFRRRVERVTGGTLEEFWSAHVDGTAEIPWARFLARAGLRLAREPRKEGDLKLPPQKTWLGIVGSRAGDRVAVSTVRSNSPAEKAGLCAADEIVAVSDARVDPETWSGRVEERKPGDKVKIAFFRGPFLREAEVTLGTCENVMYALKRVERPTALQKSIYASWMAEKWPAKD